MSPGALAFRVASEARSMRAIVEERLGWPTSSTYAREGLLVGRPAVGAAGERAAWIAYESGDVVLRRSRHEREVVAGAAFHLLSLQAALRSELLPLRLRAVLLQDGSALLVDNRAIYDVAGHDRWYAAHGCDVLPTTIAVVDPGSMELVLPEQDVDERVPAGRVSIQTILLRPPAPSPLQGADLLLALAAAVVRDRERDLQMTLDQIDRLTTSQAGSTRLLDRGDITEAVKQYAHRPEA